MRHSGCVRGQQHLRVRSTGGAVAGECSCEPVLSPQSPGWHSHPTVHNNALLCSIYATRTLHPAREKLVIGTGHVMAVEQMKRRVSQAQARCGDGCARWVVPFAAVGKNKLCRRLYSAEQCTPHTHTHTHHMALYSHLSFGKLQLTRHNGMATWHAYAASVGTPMSVRTRIG
jgi:hypothetical protein